ncbi:MAG: 4Fe-4S binding protein [Anaerovoracaceae bacterium]|jgi:ferredoxin
MTIQEIYEAFDRIGCLSFATVNADGEPEIRTAHLRAYDEDGIYFMTMYTKDFYRELKATGKVAVNGLCADTQIRHDENGFPIFERGYSIRMTGTVKEIPMEEIKRKNNPIFDFCIKDQEKYPAMVVFCITSARGDIFDYDFEKTCRDTKLERQYFSFHGAPIKYKGLRINQEKCTGCGICQEGCSFLAISEHDGQRVIDRTRCDECGDCVEHCPSDAVEYRR